MNELLAVFALGAIVFAAAIFVGRWRRSYLTLRDFVFPAKRIGYVRYGASIWMSKRPECRIAIAVAEMQADGWLGMNHYDPAEHQNKPVEVFELGSTGHHRAIMMDGSWWVIDGGDWWPCTPALWRRIEEPKP